MSSQTEYTRAVLISLHLTKVRENHLRCFFKSPSLRVSHNPGPLSCAWGMTALHEKNFPANCNGWFFFFSPILLGDPSKDEIAVPVSVNVGQECLQGLWGIVLLISVAPRSEKYSHSSLLVVLWAISGPAANSHTGFCVRLQVGLVYMFNLIVGTGALTMPKAFATAGWLVSLVLLMFLGFMR